jgi:hypothetical protein
MSISRTAYNTTACSGFVLTKTTQALFMAIADGAVDPVPNAANGLLVLQSGNNMAAAVPAFAHPMEMTGKETHPVLITDMRSFGSWNHFQNEYRITNSIAYALELNRAKLNYIWLAEGPNALRDVSQISLAVYASWIGENVARRFALDPREQLNLTILAAIFYNSLFIDTPEVEDRDYLRAVGAISRALRVTAQDVITVYEMVGVTVIGSIAEFCALAEKASNSIRLKELNVGILFSILGGTWFSTNKNEMVAVALEHPPTWLAILLGAFSERSYKNSGITKLAERIASRTSGQDYMRSVLNMISTLSAA